MSKLEIPATTEELEELLGDQKRVSQLIEQKQLPAAIRAYVAALGPAKINRPDLSANIGDGDGSHGRKVFNRQSASWAGALGRKADGMFGSFGELVRSISPASLQSRGIRNDYSSIEPSAGGFLVPESYRSELLSVALDEAIVRPLATVIPMSSSRQIVPGLDDTTHASSVFGGVLASWTEEGASLGESEAKFARVVLQASKLAIRCDVPNELLQDASPGLDAILPALFGQAIAFFEDKAFLAGNGVGQPLGVLNSPALIVQAKETNQPAATVVYQNLANMYSRLLSRSRRKAVWVCSDETLPQLLELAIAVGTGGSWVPVLNTENGECRMLGLPAFFSEHMPRLGQQGDVALLDLSYYLVGDRAEMRLQASEHAQFTTDQTVYRCIERVDGRGWLQSAITPENGGPTRSCFVALAARP
jgi:HK97 family phage major capsid protein